MISIIINSLERGGAERSVLLLLQKLIDIGVAAEVVCLYAGRNEYEVSAGLRAHVKSLGSESYGQALLRLFRHLVVRRDRLLFSLMPQSNIAAMCIGKLLGVKVITSERTTPMLFYRSKIKLVLALMPHVFSDRAVFISHYALQHGLPANWQGRAVSRNALVLHNAVPVPVDSWRAAKSRVNRLNHLTAFFSAKDEGCLRLLIASRLVEGKGILEFLECTCGFIRGAKVRIDIAGAGPLEQSIRQAVIRMHISDRVVFHGFVDDIFDLYLQSDLVILTSESEGFGRVGFEAYQAGCLVVGTRGNSFWEEVIDQAPAWIKLDDYSSLGAELRKFATNTIPFDGSDIKKMSAALSIEKHTANFLSCLRLESGAALGLDRQ